MCYLYHVGKNSSTGVSHHVRDESRLCLYIIALESAGRYCSTVSVQNSHNRYCTIYKLLLHGFIRSKVHSCYDTIRIFSDECFPLGIRRFIRELEIDGKLYELRLRQHHPGQNVQGDSQLEHEGKNPREGIFCIHCYACR